MKIKAIIFALAALSATCAFAAAGCSGGSGGVQAHDTHKFTDYKPDGNATCTEGGTKTAKCDYAGCKATDTVANPDGKLGHSFRYYVPDGNTTCDTEGTKTATCSREGCNEKDTVPSGMIGHTYDFDGECYNCGCTELQYSLNEQGDGYCVTGVSSHFKGTEVVIPATEKGLPVVAVYGGVFTGNSAYRSVTVPDSVTLLGRDAFKGCANLSSVTLGAGVETIYGGAFAGCEKLTEITVAEDNSVYGGVGGMLIERATKTLVRGGADGAIPDDGSVEIIGSDAFSQLSTLTSVTIPDCITEIGDGAFFYCTSLSGIELPASVKKIGGNAFAGSGIKSVKFGGKLDSVGQSAFTLCVVETAETDISNIEYIPKTNLKTVKVSGGDVADRTFANAPKLEKVVLGEGVTAIGEMAFFSCKELTGMTVPDSVKSIGGDAFASCTKLESIDLGDGVLSIGEWIFSSCEALESVTGGSSVKTVGDNAFRGCTALTTLEVSSVIEYFGISAISDCAALQYNEFGNAKYLGNTDNPYAMLVKAKDKDIESCEISGGAVIIYDYAFWGCKALTTVTMSESVHSIGSRAFYDCNKLEGIALPEKVTEIKAYTFYGCYALAEVTFGSGVRTIEKYAFDHAGITALNLPASVEEISDKAFVYCKSIATITVGEGNERYSGEGNCLIDTQTKTLIRGCAASVIPADGAVLIIGADAFNSCFGLTEIIIPEGVENIEAGAFSNCNQLVKVTVANSVKTIGENAFSSLNLRDVTIGTGVETIGKSAFWCSSIESIILPESLKSIGSIAFDGCKKLNRIIFAGTVAQWEAVEKAEDWTGDIEGYTVVCRDSED